MGFYKLREFHTYQVDFPTLEYESCVTCSEGGQDGEDLLGYNRQHLNVNPVELVEAAPGSCLCEPTEHATHTLEIQAFRAVHNDDVVS